MDLELLITGLVTTFELLDDVRLAGSGQERRQPIMVLDDLVGDHTGGDLPGPADHLRHPEGAFPTGVLLAAEWGGRPVGPGIGVWAIVGAVDDDGVLGDTQIIECIKHLSDVSVVVDHGVVIPGLPAPGLAHALRFGVGEQMHVGEVQPDEKRCVGTVLTFDEIDAGHGDVIVDSFHPLFGQRARVFDALLARRPEALIDFAAVLLGGPAFEYAARQQRVVEQRRFFFGGVIRVLGFLLGVEVIQVAEKLIKAVHRGQVLVEVAVWFLPNCPVA